MSTEAPTTSRPSRALWLALLATTLALAGLLSIIQPLGRCPDEAAHVTYLKFLADKGRLPIWSPQGGGEAGYEAQHPVLYYAVLAVVYQATGSLPEHWRWNLMRWFNILLLGLPMFFICRGFFSEVLRDRPWLAFFAGATVLLMPLHLLYICHINPDCFAMLWTSLGLWLAWRLGCRGSDARLALILGAVCGLAALSKASGFPILVVALAAQIHRLPAGRRLRVSLPDLGVTLLGFVLICGWWYARNAFYYGTALIHTTGQMGSGLEAGFREGLFRFAWLTWRETYLSTWVQRGWFPAGLLTGLLYGIIFVMTGLTLMGLSRGRRQEKAQPTPEKSDSADLRRALNLGGLLTALVFLGHQWAYWTMDVEFNAGGRYMLVALVGIALLIIVGVRRAVGRQAQTLLWAWTVALLVMTSASAWNIWFVLNPRYAPHWQVFHFPL